LRIRDWSRSAPPSLAETQAAALAGSRLSKNARKQQLSSLIVKVATTFIGKLAGTYQMKQTCLSTTAKIRFSSRWVSFSISSLFYQPFNPYGKKYKKIVT
jgi:hypothetical protein